MNSLKQRMGEIKIHEVTRLLMNSIENKKPEDMESKQKVKKFEDEALVN